MENVWACRLCGTIDPAERRMSRCQSCGAFSSIVELPRHEADRIARRRRNRGRRRRWLAYAVVGVLVVGVAFWLLRFLYDWGPYPPSASTQINASLHLGTWSQARRTPQNIGFTPDEPSQPRHVRWTYRTSKALHASPAIVGDDLYLTTGDGRVLALDRQTGKAIWVYTTGSLSASSPAVAGDWLIVAVRPGRIMALGRHTGELRWQTDLQHPIMALASPLIVQGSVYIGASDGKLYALDMATGQKRWAFATKDWILSTAAVTEAHDHVIVTSKDTLVYVVGAKSGRRRLAYPTGWGAHGGAGVAVLGERAYFGTHGGRVSAMAWRNLTYPWEKVVRLWRGRLYMWGVLKQAPEQKGRVWSTRVGGEVVHPPAIAHQSIYAVTVERGVASLAAETGEVRWQVKLDTDVTAAPTVAGNTVLVGTQTGVVAFDAHSGEHSWAFPTPGKVTGSPVVVDGTMYVPAHDGVLYAVTSTP